MGFKLWEGGVLVTFHQRFLLYSQFFVVVYLSGFCWVVLATLCKLTSLIISSLHNGMLRSFLINRLSSWTHQFNEMRLVLSGLEIDCVASFPQQTPSSSSSSGSSNFLPSLYDSILLMAVPKSKVIQPLIPKYNSLHLTSPPNFIDLAFQEANGVESARARTSRMGEMCKMWRA